MNGILVTILEREGSSWLFLLLLLAIVYSVGISINAYWRLRQFKGPPLAAWSFIWYLRAATSGRCHILLSEVNTKYGPLARIGPNMLITSDEELYRRTNARNAEYSRAYWYKAFRFGADKENILSEIDNGKHHKFRKQVAPGYSGKDNLCLESDIDTVIWLLIKSWKERYISKGSDLRPMDLSLQMQFLTLDIITNLSFGEPLGHVTSDSDLYEYISTTSQTLPVMSFCSAVPVISRLLGVPWIQRLISPSMKDRIGVGKVKALCKEVIVRRFAEAKAEDGARTKSDMTGSFIAHHMALDEVTDNALLNILAGSDTTSVVIRAALVSILSQPKALQKLRTEIDSAQVPSDQIISYAKSQQLPYLQACINEALRYHPAATGLLPRVVPPQGDYYKGQFIPGGTLIGQCAWNLHRLNFDAYGTDANVFRPERWIEASEAAHAGKPSQLEKMERSQELVFASGEFKCLGYRISLIELSKILFELFRRFDFGFIDGYCTLKQNLNYGLFVQEGIWVRVEER